MKKLILVLCAAYSLMAGPHVIADSSRSDSYNECNARCSVMEGEGRYTCIKTCISSKRKNSPLQENEAKSKFKECESACASQSGIENIRCIRICLDNKKYTPPVKKEDSTTESKGPCESRCGLLTGQSRENCIVRCEKKSRFDGSGPSGKKNNLSK